MRTLIHRLSSSGELLRVERTVSATFELAAVSRAVQRAGEHAVLFEAVEGTSLRVVSNLYGSHERLRRLIGAGDRSFCERWSARARRGSGASAFLFPRMMDER